MSRPTCQSEACNHPLSFHGGSALDLGDGTFQVRAGGCQALGCHCEAYVGEDPGLPSWVPDSMTVNQAASALGRSQSYVREHGSALGGVKVDGRWCFQPDS